MRVGIELTEDEAARWKLDGVVLSRSRSVKKVDGGLEVGAGSYRFEVEGAANRE